MSENQMVWAQPSDIIHDLPVAYTEVDTQGILRVVNDAACRLLNMTAEEMIGHPVWEFAPSDEVDRARTDFFHTMESGEDPPITRRSLYNATGEFRTLELHRRMIRDTDGQPIGLCSATFDVTEAEAAHRETRQLKLWLESVIEAIPQAVIVTDALGFVRHANPAAEMLTGWAVHEQIGKQVEKVIPTLHVNSSSHHAPSFRMALREAWNGDVQILTRERQVISVWLSASPIIDKQTGYTNGVVIVLPSPKVRAIAFSETE